MTSEVLEAQHPLRVPIMWGVIVGVIQAASPLAFWWLDPATVYGLSLVGIAFIYIGFAVADGRRRVIAVECCVVGLFVALAAAGITGSAWLLVVGLAGGLDPALGPRPATREAVMPGGGGPRRR